MMLISLQYASDHLRRDTTDDDVDLTAKIAGASQAVMHYCNTNIDTFTDSAGEVFDDSNASVQKSRRPRPGRTRGRDPAGRHGRLPGSTARQQARRTLRFDCYGLSYDGSPDLGEVASASDEVSVQDLRRPGGSLRLTPGG